MSSSLEVNPEARSTWQNYPRPGLFKEFEDELHALGGRHTNGRWNLELAWLPDVKHFRHGGTRHTFIDTRIPARRVEKSLGYKVKLVGAPDSTAEYVASDDKRLLEFGPEYMVVPAQEVEVVTVSYQRFGVLQYIPPERMDEGPASWERKRYGRFVMPETGIEGYYDKRGPYPAEGKHDLLLVIQAPDPLPWFDVNGTYREPARDCLEYVQAALKFRELKGDTRTYDERVAADYEAADAAEERWERDLNSKLDGALGWHGKEERAADDSFHGLYSPPKRNKGANRHVSNPDPV